ncbi:hybrid sensor histidine kinase/response regulator [Chondromyces apiculatus]|nr:ATP-binding protein [Chondromyces apiculatus]
MASRHQESAGPGRVEGILEGQRQALELAMREAPLGAVLQSLTRTAEKIAGEGVVASILLLDRDGLHVRHGAAPGLSDSYNRLVDGAAIGPAVGSCGTAAYTGQTAIATDIETDPRWASFRGPVLEQGLRACWSTPILSSGGAVLGTFALYCREARGPTPDDMDLVERLTRTAALVIERHRETEDREQTERALRELREQDRRKDEFLATLAHELRNPLAPMRNALEILRLSTDPAAQDSARHMTERQLRQVVRLVDDLLDISRINTGKLELRRERVDLRAVLRSAVETSRPLIDAGSHTLLVVLPDTPLHLDADPTRIAQVILNLLNNAAKYSEPGGRITLTVTCAGAEAVIRVKDTGVGIAADMLPRIFDMFTQVDRSLEKAQGGLGIGLTLVKRLVEMHDGAISAASEGPGKGSEFVIRLPLKDGAEISPATIRPAAPDAEQGSRLRVLVVDDNHDSAESLAMLLELTGHEVRTAHDGIEALQAAETFQPALILLDIGLPGLNGYEVAQRIRANPALTGVKLAALTGWGQAEDRRRSRASGFDYHLVKPTDPNAVEKIIAEIEASARTP